MSERIVIVGNGISGVTAARFIRKSSDASITIVSSESPRRVLYCGVMDGSFIFAMRSLESERSSPTTVIRGKKLCEEQFEPNAFADFIHEYAIEYVVLECRDITLPWDGLQTSPTASMKLMREFPMVCIPYTSWNGSLFVYRNTSRSSNPKNTLQVTMPKVGSDFVLELEQ